METATYEQTTTTTITNETEVRPKIGFHKEFVRSLLGILLISSLVLDVICDMCVAFNTYFSNVSLGRFIETVNSTAIFVELVLLALYFTAFYYRLPGPMALVTFVYYGVVAALLFICACVSAANGSDINMQSAAVAAAIFLFLNTAVHGILTFFAFRVWRAGGNRAHRSYTVVGKGEVTTHAAVAGNAGAVYSPTPEYNNQDGNAADYSHY